MAIYGNFTFTLFCVFLLLFCCYCYRNSVENHTTDEDPLQQQLLCGSTPYSRTPRPEGSSSSVSAANSFQYCCWESDSSITTLTNCLKSWPISEVPDIKHDGVQNRLHLFASHADVTAHLARGRTHCRISRTSKMWKWDWLKMFGKKKHIERYQILSGTPLPST